MLTAVLNLSLQSVDHLAEVARLRRQRDARHPLSAYPRLQTLIQQAERSGTLAAERRRLIHRVAA